MTDKATETTPTWGYHRTEPARIFELKDGEKLPSGWEDSPAAFEEKDEDEKRQTRAKAGH